jgi:methyl-accepting chemotaxis protein
MKLMTFRFGIGARLAAGFAIMVALLVAVTVKYVANVQGLNADLVQINDVNAVKQRYAMGLSGAVHDRAIVLRDVVLLDGPERDAAIAAMSEMAQAYATAEAGLMQQMQRVAVSQTERALVDRIAQIRARTNPLEDRVIALRQADDTPAAVEALAQVRPVFDEWLTSVSALLDYLRAENDRITGDVRATTGAFLSVALVGLGLAVLVALATAFLVARSIQRPVAGLSATMVQMSRGDYRLAVPYRSQRDEIGDMARTVELFREALVKAEELKGAQMAQQEQARARAEGEAARQARVVRDVSAGLARLADGDLTQPIASPANDPFPAEYEALRTAYNEVIDRLAGTMARIGAVSAAVRAGSGEINEAAQDLSARAETQAATLEQSAAALNELAQSVRSTASSAAAAENASQSNRRNAESGAQIVREAVEAMRGIEHSSKQITQIIGVIDDIAFQTNLLALNAGVEAARAGEAGRGFAVVASEVRGLAQRASDSARQIKALIRESASQVDAGSALVERTGASLEGIVQRASEVSDLVAEIAKAAAEQAAGLDEINTGVNQLDQVTQRNAAAAEKTTAASTALLQKAEDLALELSGFRTPDHLRPASELAADQRPRPAPRDSDRPANAIGTASRAKRAVGQGMGQGAWASF